MTIGYPDYQNYPMWAGAAIAVPNAPVSNAVNFVKDYQLGNFSSIWLFTNAVTFGTKCLVTYYSDSTKSVQLHTYQWVLQAGTSVSVIIPNLGPFAEITISQFQGGSQNVTLDVIPLNVPVTRMVYPAQRNTVSKLASIAAGAVLLFTMPQTMEGTLYFTVTPGDATGKVDYEVWETMEDAALNNVLTSDLGAIPRATMVASSSNFPVTVRVANNDAVNPHNYGFYANVVPSQ